jgi:phosphate-selective porin OprO/OprP
MRSRRGGIGALAVWLACLAWAGSAGAQILGLFYAEERKDNRIYVFNNKGNWERFKASGETGTGLTRLGVGPNGETVFADNETALELFFFKHGIQEEVPRPTPPVQTIVWRDGKTRITMGSAAYLEMSNRIQTRWTEELPDESVQLAGTANRGDAKGSFRIRRAKFKIEGWFYKPWLQYEMQTNWPDVTGSPASRFFEDGNINWDFTKGKQRLMVRFGQFKAPYGRQELTSSGAQQFVDRSIVSERYNPGRDTGIALWGKSSSNKIEWRAMASNGNGRSQAANDNSKYLYTARLLWQPSGAVALASWGSGALQTEGDLDTSDRPFFAVAGNFLKNDRSSATTAVDLDDTQWSADVIFKRRGFGVVAEYHYRNSSPETGAEFKDKGWLVQGSYAWKTKGGPASYWEVAGRYSEIDPSDARGGDKRKEVGGALNYYYNRHNLKVQADFRNLKDAAANTGRGTSTNEFRLQTQFIF